MRRFTSSLIMLLSMFIIAGCWDRVELNDRAFVIGWGMDRLDNGSYRGSAQIVVPSKLAGPRGSTQGPPYIVETGTGKNIMEATDAIQTKLSRKSFGGHRRAIYVGEQLAKYGIHDIVDEYIRNPEIRLRADMFVIKGGEALDILKVPYPFERIPSMAFIKAHEKVGVKPELSLRNFLMAASGMESNPILPVLEMGSVKDEGKSKEWNLGGIAIFNKELKMIGYLSRNDAIFRRWIIGVLMTKLLSTSLPEDKGNFVIEASQLKSKIQPDIINNQLKIKITLSGKGMMRENNTKLDISKSKNLKLLEDTLNKNTEKEVLNIIQKVQKQYGTDIFSFGTAIHRKYPYRWKKLKDNWNDEFSKTDVSVKVKLTIQRVGLTGPPVEAQKKNNDSCRFKQGQKS